jgi:hypothetical protein
MTLYKKIPSETPTKLETFIHHLLDEHRAENGDYFNVTAEKLDEAIEKAIVAVPNCIQFAVPPQSLRERNRTMKWQKLRMK